MVDNSRWRIAPVAGFTPLLLELVSGEFAPALDLYGLVGDETKPRLLASRTNGVDRDRLEELRAEGLRRVLVRDSDLSHALRQIEASLDAVLSDEALSHGERFRAMQSVVCLTLNDRLRWAESEQWVRESERVADQVVDLLVGSEATVESLFDLAEHDTTTFVHATNTAAYAALLADATPNLSEDDVRSIAVGAMLHDIGKRRLPSEILTKRGALNPRERKIIESHPTIGYEMLREQPNVAFGQLMMVYQHHEWVNGAGYPVGIDTSEIHPWARIMAVVDVFDALTARRPYKEPVSVGDALLRLAEGANEQFDTEVVRCWISIFDPKLLKQSGPDCSTACTTTC